MRRVTITEIARRVGVSHQAVSKALHGGEGTTGVSKELQERVQKVAQDLGYRLHRSARAMRVGQAGAIGLLLDTQIHRSHFHGDLLAGIQDGVEAAGRHLVIGRYGDEDLQDPDLLPRILREYLADGLLLNLHTDAPPLVRLREIVAEQRVPAVWINRKQPHDSIYPDDRKGARDLTRTLIERGLKRIAYTQFNYGQYRHHYSVEDRLSGYREAMAEAGLPTNERLLNEASVTPALLTSYREWFRFEPRPEAIVTYGGLLEPFTEFVLPELGLRPNQDIFLATFTEIAPDPCAATAAVARIDWRMIGRTAVEVLQRKIAHPRTKQPSRALPIEVSTRC